MKTLFRVKTTAYVVVMVFILTHICLLCSSIAECGIVDIDAADLKIVWN